MNHTSVDPIKQQIIQAVENIKPLLERLPGVSIVHDIRDGSVIYMTPNGLQQLGVSMEELINMGTYYYPRFFNAEEAREYVPKMLDMMERNDPAETFTFFQQVKFAKDNSWHWHISSVRILEHDKEGKPIASITLAQLIHPDQHYTPKIERLLDELTLLRANIGPYSSLGKREKEVLKLLSSGYTSVQIADELHISTRTVETHRKNIRKKLGAKTQADLDRYARAFDLV